MSVAPDIPCPDKSYYARVTFAIGHERGAPKPGPDMEADHLASYQRSLCPSKEAALQGLMKARRGRFEVSSETLFSPPDWLPEYEGPLDPDCEYICACTIDEEGEIALGCRDFHIELRDVS